MNYNILEGVVIGASGGSIAGITVYLIQYFHQKIRDFFEMRKVNRWLKKNSPGGKWHTARAIASWNNLPEDRVRYLCSIDKDIELSSELNDALWAHRETVNLIDC